MLSKADLTPPATVAREAAKGLELHEKFNRGGTEVGWRRAAQLRDREPVSEEDIKSIYSYFARHAVDERPGWDDESDPSAGYIAWLLWGGDEGRAWISKLHERLAQDPG